ncbi:hypothetical protein MBLNU459_g8130t2 [Dothideomycetes sp. NU459]
MLPSQPFQRGVDQQPNPSFKSIPPGSLQATAVAHMKPLKSRSEAIHSATLALADQEKDLRKQTERLAKQNREWEKLVDDGTKGLKETGDVQNWAEVIERELLVIEEVLRMVEEEGTDAEGERAEVPDRHASRDGDVNGKGKAKR